MPTYEYLCGECGYQFEELQKIVDDPLVTCPSCGKDSLRRLVSATAFHLKGSGWYKTDYASSSSNSSASNSNGSSTNGNSTVSSSSSDAGKGDNSVSKDTSTSSPSESGSQKSTSSETKAETKTPVKSSGTSDS
jgi:putative FmdB family regulatory protein